MMKLQLDKLNPLYLIAIIALVVGLFFLYKRNKRSPMEPMKVKEPMKHTRTGRPRPPVRNIENLAMRKSTGRPARAGPRPRPRASAPPKPVAKKNGPPPMGGPGDMKPSSTGQPWAMDGGLLSDVTKDNKGEVAAAGGSEIGALL
ncbi:MAG: hypothetical protein CL926_11900 [Deltaproteobacteria bacterium]|jgi:hypothetical protein|nr:hypothetical protein [Deltaproteobacteria bacterium]